MWKRLQCECGSTDFTVIVDSEIKNTIVLECGACGGTGQHLVKIAKTQYNELLINQVLKNETS